MANKQINARVALKNDFEANWIIAGNNNFIPLKGEEILYNAETDDSPLPVGRTYRISYNRRKIGDGKRNVNELPFEEEEQFIPIENPDVFIFDQQTMTWNINPFGSFILTKDYPGTQLPGGDSMMHTCQYFKGDIVRNEIIGSSAIEDGKPYSFKQTIYHSTMPMEHYRYWRPISEWTLWDYTVHGPKPIGANGVVDQMVGLTIDTTDPAGGFVQLSYCSTDKAVDHYGKTHFVSFDESTALTDAQKGQARENIGAPALGANIPDGALLIYNAQTKQITNSGYTIDTLKQWVRDYVETYISTEITIDDNGNQILSVTGKETVIDNPDGSQTLIIGG